MEIMCPKNVVGTYLQMYFIAYEEMLLLSSSVLFRQRASDSEAWQTSVAAQVCETSFPDY